MHTKDFRLPKLSSNKIIKRLKSKPLENIDLINRIEEWLIEKRNYVFKMPPENSHVILLLSGGFDTTIIWDILMRIYKLHVHPLFIRRGQIRMPSEEAAVDFFSKYYRKIHPKLFHAPQKLTSFIPPLEIRWKITKFGIVFINSLKECRGIPLYSSQLVNIAVQYSYFLEITKALKIRTIFSGYVQEDGKHIRYESLTALRVNTFNIINLTGDINWQFTSLPIEKNLGFYFGKETLLKYALNYNIPIEKSFSCITFNYYHCGKCVYCQSRKKLFKKLRIKDKTTYLDEKSKLFYLYNKLLLIFITLKFLIRIIFTLIYNFIRYFKSD